jgi:non-heme chloroperoxidase
MKQHYLAGGNGLKLYVEENGQPDGQSIIFIHGFSQCRVAWTKQMHSSLADSFRLIGLDLRGHGLSEKLSEKEAYTDGKLWADDLAAVIDGLKLQKPVLVGWSYGGYVISDYVRYYGTGKLGGINFVAAATKMGVPESAALLGPKFQAMMRGFLSADLDTSVQTFQNFIRVCTYEEISAEEFYMMLGYNLVVSPVVRRNLFSRVLNNDDVLAQLQIPLLITHGLEDAIILPETARQHAELVKHARTSFYEQIGHLPFVESTERFNAELAAFAQECQSGS